MKQLKSGIIPQLGEVKRGREIWDGNKSRVKYIRIACIDCGEERWGRLCLGEPRYLRCHKCTFLTPDIESPKGKGGRPKGSKSRDGGLHQKVERFFLLYGDGCKQKGVVYPHCEDCPFDDCTASFRDFLGAHQRKGGKAFGKDL